MPNEDEPEKKFRIRPRKFEGPKAEEDPPNPEEPETEAKTRKWDNRLRQSGVKFPAKKVSKVREKPDVHEASGATKDSGADAQASAGGTNPSINAQPEGWESESTSRSDPTPHSSAPLWSFSQFKFSDWKRLVRRLLRKRIRVQFALLGTLVIVLIFCLIFWNLGIGRGKRISLQEATKENSAVPVAMLAEVDSALADLRMGNPEKALKALRHLENSDTKIASLSYLIAIAAMQNGDIRLAEAKAAESIAKRERISDCLALQSALEIQKRSDSSMRTFGDTRLRSEILLKQAIQTDVANPTPLIELSSLLRSQKRNEEAVALLKAANSRLNPVDSHSVVRTTLELCKLEELPDANLPEISTTESELSSVFANAYTAMRRGKFDQAAEMLKTVQKSTPPDLFDYLVNDPAIRRFSGEPKLRGFFQ